MQSSRNSGFFTCLHNRKLQILVGFLLLILALSLVSKGYSQNLNELTRYLDDILAIAKSRPMLTGITFLVFFSACCASPLPVVSLLIIAAGYLFGYTFAFLLTEVGALIGASITFLTYRKLFKEQVSDTHSIPTILQREVNDAGFLYALSARFIPGIPFFIMNLGQSMTSIRFTHFIAAAFFGTIPTFLVFINAGVHLQSVESLDNLMSANILVSLLIIALLPLCLRGLYILINKQPFSQ